MPLDRGHVTAASRIMLPVHIAFSAALGWAWLAQDTARTAVPSLTALRDVWPIANTGVVLIVVAVVALVGVLSGRRTLAGVMLLAGALAYAVLTVAVAWPLLDGAGSYSAPLWPAYVAFAHLASAVSLARNEKDHT